MKYTLAFHEKPHTAYKANRKSLPVLPKHPYLNFIFCTEIITHYSPWAHRFFFPIQGRKSSLCLVSQLTQPRGSLTGTEPPGYNICWAQVLHLNCCSVRLEEPPVCSSVTTTALASYTSSCRHVRNADPQLTC